MKNIAQQIISNAIVSKVSNSGSSANSVSSVSWADVKNKPLAYTPDMHNNSVHSEQYLTHSDIDGVSKKQNTFAMAMAIALG